MDLYADLLPLFVKEFELCNVKECEIVALVTVPSGIRSLFSNGSITGSPITGSGRPPKPPSIVSGPRIRDRNSGWSGNACVSCPSTNEASTMPSAHREAARSHGPVPRERPTTAARTLLTSPRIITLTTPPSSLSTELATSTLAALGATDGGDGPAFVSWPVTVMVPFMTVGWTSQWKGYSPDFRLAVLTLADAAGAMMLVSNNFPLVGSSSPFPLVTV